MFKALALALMIWLGGTGLLLAGWMLLADDIAPAPVCYPCAISEARGYERFGWITHEEAERRIDTARFEYVVWGLGLARTPVIVSFSLVPIAAVVLNFAFHRPSHQSRGG